MIIQTLLSFAFSFSLLPFFPRVYFQSLSSYLLPLSILHSSSSLFSFFSFRRICFLSFLSFCFIQSLSSFAASRTFSISGFLHNDRKSLDQMKGRKWAVLDAHKKNQNVLIFALLFKPDRITGNNFPAAVTLLGFVYVLFFSCMTRNSSWLTEGL